jgi:hypothetical protein
MPLKSSQRLDNPTENNFIKFNNYKMICLNWPKYVFEKVGLQQRDAIIQHGTNAVHGGGAD